MVYKMVMYVDGGCRRNGFSGAFGACACVCVYRWGRDRIYTKRLPASDRPVPTNQRAELYAIILALEQASNKQNELDNYPYMHVTIYTDSKYAHGCMTEWYRKWQNNGFINSLGNEVANRDLIERALALESDILDHGNVIWEWTPRSDNTAADEAANDEMDAMDGAMDETSDGSSDESSDY